MEQIRTLVAYGGYIIIIDIHYKLSVARRAILRQLLIARDIKVVVLGVREDDLASPECNEKHIDIIPPLFPNIQTRLPLLTPDSSFM